MKSGVKGTEEGLVSRTFNRNYDRLKKKLGHKYKYIYMKVYSKHSYVHMCKLPVINKEHGRLMWLFREAFKSQSEPGIVIWVDSVYLMRSA